MYASLSPILYIIQVSGLPACLPACLPPVCISIHEYSSPSWVSENDRINCPSFLTRNVHLRTAYSLEASILSCINQTVNKSILLHKVIFFPLYSFILLFLVYHDGCHCMRGVYCLVLHIYSWMAL